MKSLIVDYEKKSVSFQEEKPYVRRDINLRVPDTGFFVQLKTWGEMARGDNAKPYPQMFNPSMGLELRDPNGRVYEYVETTPALQKFIYDVLEWSAQYKLPKGVVTGTYTRPYNHRTFYNSTPGSMTQLWIKFTEAHVWATEGGSREAGSEDFVLGINKGASEAIKWLFDPMGNAMLKVIATEGEWYVIEAIDVLKPLPSISELEKKPWLIFWATIWGKYIGSQRFPHLKEANKVWGLPESGIATPLLSKGGRIRIKKSSCKILKNGSSWSPYT